MPATPLVRMVVGAAAPSRGALLRAMLPRVANTVAHLQFRIRLAQRRMRGRESDAMDLGPNRVGRQRFVRPNRLVRRVHRVGIVRRTGQARSSIGIAGQCCPLWPENRTRPLGSAAGFKYTFNTEMQSATCHASSCKHRAHLARHSGRTDRH